MGHHVHLAFTGLEEEPKPGMVCTPVIPALLRQEEGKLLRHRADWCLKTQTEEGVAASGKDSETLMTRWSGVGCVCSAVSREWWPRV